MSKSFVSYMSHRVDLPMGRHAAVFLSILAGACLAQAAAAVERPALATSGLSAAQIVDKHVAARGGLAAWRAVQTLSVTGKLEAGSPDSVARSAKIARQGLGARGKRGTNAARVSADPDKSVATQEVLLPFRLEMKRPRKSRLEIDFAGKTAVQVYDGQAGWKLRPYLNRDDVEPFTADETKAEAAKADLEGPLMDYAAKGTHVALEGVEPVEGRNAYKLKLTMANGDVQHIWIDTQSFLDVKVEGTPHRLDGKVRSVWVYQRDFKSVQGLMVPFVIDTTIDGNPHAHKMVIESVAVNRALDDARFAKPQVLVAASPPPPAAAATAKPAPPKNPK